MGHFKVRNLLLSKKLKLSETRVLIIDDNQIRYNALMELFQSNDHLAQGLLLDDLKSFEKQLNTSWDLIIFGRAYDLKMEQAVTLIQASEQVNIPVILIRPTEYKPEQYEYFIHKGIYDIIDLTEPERCYISLVRALSYSRTLQSKQRLLQDLESAKTQAQSLVEEQHKASALIEEGIHTQANPEYLQLFGISSEDDIIGLPVLDILQPEDLNDFKNRFKKISQGQFDYGRFDIKTRNQNAQSKNPLKIEFLPGLEEDSLHLTIEMASAKAKVNGHDTSSSTTAVFAQINRAMINQPAKANALIVFSLAQCPNEILNLTWQDTLKYFEGIQLFIKEQTNQNVLTIDTGVYGILLQAGSESLLESRISNLNVLQKPQLLEINQKNYSFHLKIGYASIQTEHFNEAYFSALVSQAYNSRLSTQQSESDLQMSASLQETQIELAPLQLEEIHLEDVPSQSVSALENTTLTLEAQAEPTPSIHIPIAAPVEEKSVPAAVQLTDSPILRQITEKLEQGEIRIKYQQLYDKQDTNLYTYEVTSGFIYENQWKTISNLVELDDDIELSIKLDRWILVEACKQLHNFIHQYPAAKIVVNLNRHVLFHDKQFPELISKLITIVGSRATHPIILQFDEEDIAKNILEAQKHISTLREYGADIAIRRFGSTISSETILKQSDITHLTLDEKYTHMLAKDTTLQSLQEMIQKYMEIKPVEFLLIHLDDMNAFANAWNVDARFLQGDYFQKKLDQLTDVQDQ
ncbi:diguanylate phosphodiesterase [Acinetobacter defluvii]|uniref:EAL domain-containing protein n=1 Tax=Acinetobacter defluvii TaxID=1871111 RepID=UPI0014904B4A|nr:EAL domain-containing protein [Acinetobacter defluvii]NNP73840.1 diguanylate phosphodiesterase [Acinetobacter defluvii]